MPHEEARQQPREKQWRRVYYDVHGGVKSYLFCNGCSVERVVGSIGAPREEHRASCPYTRRK